MESPDLDTVEKVRAVIEELITYRSHLAVSVPYFAPTDIADLTPAKQLSESRIQEENDYGNRVRAAIQMSLAAAAASLRLAESLMHDDAQLDLRERRQNLARCTRDAQACRDVAGHVVALLAGKEAPRLDALLEIRKLKDAIHERFGRWPGST